MPDPTNQPWLLSETEKAFVELREQTDDASAFDDADNPGELVQRLVDLSTKVGVPQYANYCLTGLASNGRFDDLIASHVASPQYVAWQEKYSPASILSSKEFASGKFNAVAMSEILEIENRIKMLQRRDHYAYLLSQGDDEDSFDDYIKKYGGLLGKTPLATEAEIGQLEVKLGRKIPNELKEFYAKIGCVKGDIDGGSVTFQIYSAKELLASLDDSRPRYDRLFGLGVVDMLYYVWGNDKEEFSDSSAFLSNEQMDALNDQYKAIGLIREDDNVNYAIYFDPQGKFGAVYYNQDDGDVFTKYLEPMLKASPAKRTLSAVLTSAIAESAVRLTEDFTLKTWCEGL